MHGYAMFINIHQQDRMDDLKMAMASHHFFRENPRDQPLGTTP